MPGRGRGKGKEAGKGKEVAAKKGARGGGKGRRPRTLDDDTVDDPGRLSPARDSGQLSPAGSVVDPQEDTQVRGPTPPSTDDTQDRGRPTEQRKKRAEPVTTLGPFKTKDQQEAFVEWWKGEPCLYDKKCDGYHRRDHKDNLLRTKAADLGITEDQLAKYMKHMRDAFNKISKEVDARTRSGAGQVDQTEFLSAHDIWLHRVMGWIKVHLQHHKGMSVGVS
jgi:hypothetical protein